MIKNRQLNWDGCDNVRDLGGLHTTDGCKTRWGAMVRSDDPSKLTESGWAALYEHGIRTIISLRTDGVTENILEAVPDPYAIMLLRVAIEDIADKEFVQQWVDSNLWCTPLYYHDALMRWPEKHAAAIAAVARTRPGGVLFHCRRGHDRTGIIAMLLLALVGVNPDEIADDYEMSPDPERYQILKSQGTSTRDVILNTVRGFDVDDYLLAGGLSPSDLEVIRERFLEPPEVKSS